MKKIIYTLLLLGFTSLSFSQDNFLLNTTDPDMLPLTGSTETGFLGRTLCQGQNTYIITPEIVNLNDTSESIPTDLEYEIIPIPQSGAVTIFNPPPSTVGSVEIDLNSLTGSLNMTARQRRYVAFIVSVIDYPESHIYYRYRLIDRVFKIDLSNDQPISGAAIQNITTTCGNVATLSNISTNSSYSYINFHDDQGGLIVGNQQINPGDVITMYPKNSAIFANNGGTCNIDGFEVTIGTVTQNPAVPYVGPKLSQNYFPSGIQVCDIDNTIEIQLLSEDPSEPLTHNAGTYYLIRGNSAAFALTNPIFDTGGSFLRFEVDLTQFYGTSTYDSPFKIRFVPTNPTDIYGNTIVLCSNIESNNFNINITNEYKNLSKSFDRAYFTNGLDDLDNDGNLQEDELTYKAMYNIFLRNQVIDGASPTQVSQGFLQYPGYTYTMYKNDDSGNKVQINSIEYNDIVSEFSDLESNCREIFYFKISSTCDDYHAESLNNEYKTLTISLRDLITTYTNPDQYFCSIDNPSFESLQLLSEITGNPIFIWGSEYGSDLLYDPTMQNNGDQISIEDGDEYWIQEYGIPTISANCTGDFSEMFSSKRFYVKVHIVNNCSPATSECPCNSFELEKGDKYIVSAWVKEDHDKQVITYDKAKLDLTFLEGDQLEAEFSFSPSGEIIEGWQRIVGEFSVPITATKVRIDLDNTGGVVVAPMPVNINDYFEPNPYQGFNASSYNVNFLNNDFSNCDEISKQTYTIFSGTPLEQNKVYSIISWTGNIPGVPFLSTQYITVSNAVINNAPLLGFASRQSTISCEEIGQLLNPPVVSKRVDVFYDDIRIHPFNGNMKSFVYDPITQRLMAELDENNYATMYEYDEEGGLIRVKKETEKGVFTIQETRSKSATKE